MTTTPYSPAKDPEKVTDQSIKEPGYNEPVEDPDSGELPEDEPDEEEDEVIGDEPEEEEDDEAIVEDEP